MGGGWRAVSLSDFVILRLQTCSLQRDSWPPDLPLPASNGHGAPSGGGGQVVFPTDESQSQIWEVDWKCPYGSVPGAVKQAGRFVFCSHLSIWSLAVHTDDQLSEKFVCGLASQGPLALKNMGVGRSQSKAVRSSEPSSYLPFWQLDAGAAEWRELESEFLH